MVLFPDLVVAPGDPCLSFPVGSVWRRGTDRLGRIGGTSQPWGGPIPDVPNPSVSAGDPPSATAVPQQ